VSSARPPRGAVIEIIERRPRGAGPVPPVPEVIVPDEVRINGQALWVSSAHPITVHELTIPPREVVQVTLTLLARRVVISHEDDQPPVEAAAGTPRPAAGQEHPA
jgi:hypothetical protein